MSGLPLCTLLGGNHQNDILLYRAISQGTPKEMKDLVEKYKAMGYTRFQLKLGGNYKDDIDRIRACHSALDSQDVLIGDANTGVENTQCLKIVQKSRIQHCERSELLLHFEWPKFIKNAKIVFGKPESCCQTVLPDRLLLIR